MGLLLQAQTASIPFAESHCSLGFVRTGTISNRCGRFVFHGFAGNRLGQRLRGQSRRSWGEILTSGSVRLVWAWKRSTHPPEVRVWGDLDLRNFSPFSSSLGWAESSGRDANYS
jgi:hypothetical protein